MFAHVSPEEDSFGETISTLRFAQRVSMVELGAAASQNKESNEVLELKAEVNERNIPIFFFDLTFTYRATIEDYDMFVTA